jgi:hypothetical protein
MAIALNTTKSLSEIAAAAVASGAKITKIQPGATQSKEINPSKNVTPMVLAHALWGTIAPKVAALDDGYDGTAGHEHPSMKDKQLIGWIEYNCKQYHQQLYGVIINRDTGGTYDNASQRLSKSERDLAEYMREKQQIEGARYDGVEGKAANESYLATFNQTEVDTSPRMMSLLRWMEINYTTVEMLKEHLDAWVYCYEQLTRKRWTPPSYESVAVPPKNDTQKAHKAEAEAKVREKLAKMGIKPLA